MPKKLNKLNESISRSALSMIRDFAQNDSIMQKWEGTAYGEIQKITNPKKGLLGEALVAQWLDELGYLSEEHGYNRQKGGNNFDLLVLVNDKLERIEVKLATQDTGNKYQFNWIAIEHNIALIVFLGIDPEGLYLSVKTRKEILFNRDNPTRGKALTPVPPKSTTHVKWTASKEHANMIEIKTLGDVKKIFDAAVATFITEQKAEEGL